MHIRIDKDKFLQGIKIIGNGMHKNLDNMKIKCNKSGITLTAVNYGYTTEQTIECEILNSGIAVTRLAEIKEFLKFIAPENKTLEIFSLNDELTITTKNEILTTKLLEEIESSKSVFKAIETFAFDKVIFLSLLEKLKKVASQTEDNLAVNCIRMEIENNSLKMIATDTYRMLFFEDKLEDINIHKKSFSVSIPLNAINTLIKILKLHTNNLLTVKIGEKQILFKIQNTSITSQLITLDFPDYKNILRTAVTNKTVIIDKNKIRHAIQQLIYVVKNNYEARYAIILDFQGNTLNLIGKNNFSTINTSLYCRKSGEDLKISLNSKYLLEAIESINSEKVEMNMYNSRTSVLIKEPGNEKNIYLTMPLAIRE